MRPTREDEGALSSSAGLAYERIASIIVDKALRGRTGYGAMRKYVGVFYDTFRLIVESPNFSYKMVVPEWWFVMWDLGGPREFWITRFQRQPGFIRHCFRDVLGTASSFNPQPFWALYWAIARAEHEFLYKFVPFWSHEERLTGHLVSQVIERLTEFAPHWKSLAEGTDTNCEVWYADTATASKESVTGADLGLIIHARFEGGDEFFKVARFQAKKVTGAGVVVFDLAQLQTLLGQPNLGYYLFYHQLKKDDWSLTPTVRQAADFQSLLDKAKQAASFSVGGGPISMGKKVTGGGFDFSAFLTFAVADPDSRHGVRKATPAEAVTLLMAETQDQPSRVLVVSLGSGLSSVKWVEEFKNYLVSEPPDDNPQSPD